MTLKWNLVTKAMRPHAQLRQKLDEKISKLETHLAHFPPDAVKLRVNLQHHRKKMGFSAGLTLHLPSNVLAAEKFGPDPIPAFDQAMKALLREVSNLKASLRRESEFQSVARRRVPVSAAPVYFAEAARGRVRA
jgi:ribosome-associated translation inhibitor RaiA